MAEGEDTAKQGPGGYPRPYSHVIQSTSFAHDDMASHRLSDSRFFFSERRLSQLFNVDAWNEEEVVRNEFGDDEDPDHDPPPEPAPRASYCPPSPGTPGDPAPPPQAPDPHYPETRREPSLYSTLSSGCHLDPRFSAEVALDMARLSTLSGSSGRFSSGRLDDEEDEDEDSYGGGNNGDVTPTPGSPGTCHNAHNVPTRYSQLSTLTESLASTAPPSPRCCRSWPGKWTA